MSESTVQPATEFEAIAVARSLLFVPGDRPDRFARAEASGADGIILDLEDSVRADGKDVARANIRRWRASGGSGLVRINDATSPWHDDDVAALSDHAAAVMLPKATSAGQVRSLLDRLPGGSCVLPLIESAAGILEARAICAVPGVVRTALGNGDLANELGVDHTDPDPLRFARSALVLASAASGVCPPLDGVTTAVHDDRTLAHDSEHAAALGFSGKLCIHPRQIPVVHKTFTPSHEQLRWARKVLEASEGKAIAVVDGKLIDKPIVSRARRMLRHGSE